MFTAYLLGRNIRYEADLVDQLFNSSEKRLARTLLLLAQFGKESKPETVVPKIRQETLAEMVGTTRSRVSFFMNRFREMGFIEYNGGLEVHSSLLSVVLHDSASASKSQGAAQESMVSKLGICWINGAIFVATSTSNNVAVLRTLPEMVMSASETRGCCSASDSSRSLTPLSF